jgi:hypothetical protein
VVAAALLLGGCAAQDLNSGLIPECSVSEEVITMAQSVPSAAMLPCVESIPLGWTFRSLEVESGRAAMLFVNDRALGDTFQPLHTALEVTLTGRCDISRTTEVVSDELLMRRYERSGLVDAGGAYAGTRFYVFPGGCVSYDFDLRARGGSALAAEITDALTFVSRDSVETVVAEMGLEL